MKKVGIIVLLTIIFISQAIALSSNLKSDYQPGETMIVKLSGNIVEPISKEQVEFKRINVKMPVEYDVKKIGDNYYIWAVAPESANNYTLIINNVVATTSGAVQKMNFESNFTVGGDKVDYSVTPGFIIAQNDFKLNILSNKDEPQSISIDFPEKRTILLQPGNNEITVSVSSVRGSILTLINVGRYALPASIVGNYTGSGGYTGDVMEFIPDKISRIVFKDQSSIIYPVKIVNLVDYTLENIQIGYDKQIFSISDNEISIKANESYDFNITFKSINFSESTIYASYNNTVISLPVFVKVSEENISDILNKSNITLQGYYCSELGGKVCSASQTCNGKITGSLDGQCCIGTCTVKSSSSSYSWIGYLLAAVVLIGGIVMYFKYKKSGKSSAKQIFDRKVMEAGEGP